MREVQDNSAEFRRSLGRFATGVAIVSATGPNGHRVGMTANSFTSVSLDPPLVSWNVAAHSPSAAVFLEAEHFAVSVLSAEQADVARQFARTAPDKFAGIDLTEGLGEAWLVDGACAHFECRRYAEFEAGDHVILVGEVLRFSRGDGAPLVFHDGVFTTVTG